MDQRAVPLRNGLEWFFGDGRPFKENTMRICCDFHSHTIYGDGRNTPEEMIQAACALGLTDFGISEHGFLEHYAYSETGTFGMDETAYLRYREEMEALKEKYRNRIRIYVISSILLTIGIVLLFLALHIYTVTLSERVYGRSEQARIAADNIAGGNSVYRGTQGTSVLKAFGMTAAATGLNERAAKAAGIPYDKVFLYSANHASYYPGAQFMNLKVLFHKESGKILGAQAVGFDGTDKRIDVLATAIRAGMTAGDLCGLELAYAPPFSSAKDPVNMAGYVIENLLSGKVRQIHWHDVDSLTGTPGLQRIDVRPAAAYANGTIPGAVSIPLAQLRGRLGEIDKSRPVYVSCQTGLNSYIACRILLQNGFQAVNLAGGYRLYDSVRRSRGG